MKIALCVDHHYPGYGGPYTAVSDTAYHLYKSNVGIKLIYENNGHSIIRRNYHEIFQNVDLIHTFGIWTPSHYRAFKNAKKAKKKIIISPLGSTEPWAMKQKKIKKKLAWYLYQKRVLQNCTYLHATSDLEKKHLIELGITTPIRVIPHGIKISKLAERETNKKIKKALFFSRIHEKKGLLELVESWKEVNNTDWILEIYGPISDQKYLQSVINTIKKYNLEHCIKIYKPYFDKKKKRRNT